MHELSLAAHLVELVGEHARAEDLVQVLRVHVAVGALAAVDEEALAAAFEVARSGSVAAGAELVVERVPGRASCEGCGRVVEVEIRGAPCPECGSFRWSLVAGGELRLTGLEGI